MTAQEDKESGSLTTAKDENELKDHDQHTSVKSSSDKVDEGPPSRHLWVGNVASSVTKAQLSEQFARFGDLENVAEYPSRNYAFVNFKNKEDAVYAKKGLQGTMLGGLAVRIEFAKGNIKGEGQHRADPDESAEDSEDFEVASTKASERHKREREREEPSETLWVGFPLCMKVDERKLHKAFSPFGAVERITTFPGRTYAFVEFHSVKAAARAKNVLQGKLFNDPRVSISFAKSEIGPVEQQRPAGPILSPPPAVHDMPPILFPKPGSFVNPRNDRYLNLDVSRAQNSNVRRHLEGGINESKMFFGSHYGSGYQDGISRDTRQELETWPSSALSGGLMQHRHTSPSLEERWSVHEEATGRREPKRPRSGTNQPGVRGSLDLGVDRQTFLSLKSQDYTSRLSNVESWGDYESSKRYLQGGKQLAGYNMDSLTSDWLQRSQPVDRGLRESLHWQGVIAKSGTTVCHARCYNIGNASCKVSFPESVNCTARTSLDMLAKHINEVGEYSLVTFVPLAELDVEPYQDFIAYLSEKNRAAVCKLSMDCTLFLVPPSDFAELFLKVDRGNSIIGVVLKLQQAFVSSAEQPAPAILQPLKAEVSASALLPEMKYQNLTVHDIQLPVKTSMPLPFHSLEGVLSQSLIQSTKPATSIFSSGIVTPSTAGLNGGAVGPSSISLVSATDEKWLSHPSAGYGSMNHDQHSSATLRGGFSFSQTGELSLPEMNMQTNSNPVLSAPTQYPAPNHQFKDVSQSLQAPSGPSSYLHQPPLPQYPHPSAQQKLVASQPSQISPPIQSDQLSQLLSMVAQQTQPLPESSQAIVQPQHPANATLKPPVFPNFGHVASAASAQVFHPPQITQNNVNVIDAEQRDLLQLAQQKLSETRGDSSGEDSKRFQATLELAAALLQQLQQKSKS